MDSNKETNINKALDKQEYFQQQCYSLEEVIQAKQCIISQQNEQFNKIELAIQQREA